MIESPRSDPDEFTRGPAELFRLMSEASRFFGNERVEWFDGGIFDGAEVIPCTRDELCRSPGAMSHSSPGSIDHPGRRLISVPVCVVNHLLRGPRAGRGAVQPLAVALTLDHDLVAGVGEPVEGAVAEDRVVEESSTARLEVMTKLELRWRPMTSS